MQQIEYEKELANLLKGADIIVAGGLIPELAIRMINYLAMI